MNEATQRRWSWYQQAVDAVVAILGIGIAISMTARNSFPPWGILLVISCVGKLTATQLLKVLMAKWVP
jgi:hypothetical protein